MACVFASKLIVSRARARHALSARRFAAVAPGLGAEGERRGGFLAPPSLVLL